MIVGMKSCNRLGELMCTQLCQFNAAPETCAAVQLAEAPREGRRKMARGILPLYCREPVMQLCPVISVVDVRGVGNQSLCPLQLSLGGEGIVCIFPPNKSWYGNRNCQHSKACYTIISIYMPSPMNVITLAATADKAIVGHSFGKDCACPRQGYTPPSWVSTKAFRVKLTQAHMHAHTGTQVCIWTGFHVW